MQNNQQRGCNVAGVRNGPRRASIAGVTVLTHIKGVLPRSPCGPSVLVGSEDPSFSAAQQHGGLAPPHGLLARLRILTPRNSTSNLYDIKANTLRYQQQQPSLMMAGVSQQQPGMVVRKVFRIAFAFALSVRAHRIASQFFCIAFAFCIHIALFAFSHFQPF
jgi:hypothetical protein